MTPLCFIEPQDTVRVIAETIGAQGRRRLLGEVVRAWVDEIPERELSAHYALAVASLDADDLHELADWHAAQHIGQPIPSGDFLLGVFPTLGDGRRDALRVAAGLRGAEALDAGATGEAALAAVLPHLSHERARELARRCIELYMRDQLGASN